MFQQSRWQQKPKCFKLHRIIQAWCKPASQAFPIELLRESWSEGEGFRFSLSRASCHSGAPAQISRRIVNRRPIRYDLWEGVTTENYLCCHEKPNTVQVKCYKKQNTKQNRLFRTSHTNSSIEIAQKFWPLVCVVCASAFGVNFPRSLSQVRETIYTSTE